jgi:hypothetical protein
LSPPQVRRRRTSVQVEKAQGQRGQRKLTADYADLHGFWIFKLDFFEKWWVFGGFFENFWSVFWGNRCF